MIDQKEMEYLKNIHPWKSYKTHVYIKQKGYDSDGHCPVCGMNIDVYLAFMGKG